MPVFDIKAPDGNTYTVKAPDGATEDQAVNEVLRLHPNAANPTQAKAAPSRLQSFASDFSGIMKQRQGEAQQGVEAARKMPLSFINPVAGVKEFGANMQGALSPAYALGAALGRQIDPTFGKPGSAGGEDVKYGQLGEALVPIPAQKLAAPARVGGQVIARALEQTAPRVAETVGATFAPARNVITKVLNAGPEAKAAVGGIRQQAMAKALEEADMAKRAETMATTKAQRALTAQQSADAAAGNVSPIGVGKVTYLSERGRPAQEAVQAAEAVADQQRRQAFESFTAAIDDAVKANEQKGLFINDTLEAKKLLKETSDILSPKPGSAPTTAPMPTSGQVRAHKMIQDALQNRTVPLTAAEAEEAQGLGYKVDVIKGGGTEANPIPDTYSRTFKTPLEAVTNLRRNFGDLAYGKTDISGFEGVNASTFRDLNSKLKGVEDAYTAGLGAEQRTAYKTALENLDKFRTGVGKKLTATEGMTESNKMAASNAPKAIIGGGADTYAQFKAMNPVAADKFAKDSIETALNNPVTGKPLNYDAAAAKVGPNTQLGDIINDVPELKVRVQQHLNQLLDAKNAGIDAKSFKVDYKAASAAEKSAIDSRINYQSKFIELKNASDKEILKKSESLFNQLVTDKKITPLQYDKYLEEIKQASKKVGYKEARNKALIAASTAIGGLGLVKGVRTVQGVLGE
jgi:hypothetical protein